MKNFNCSIYSQISSMKTMWMLVGRENDALFILFLVKSLPITWIYKRIEIRDTFADAYSVCNGLFVCLSTPLAQEDLRLQILQSHRWSQRIKIKARATCVQYINKYWFFEHRSKVYHSLNWSDMRERENCNK